VARRILVVVALLLAIRSWAADAPPPSWSQLNREQQAVLMPLAAEWDSFEPARRKKWVAIAAGFHKLDAEQQRRLQLRAQQWSQLSPEQRSAVRERYRRLERLSAEDKRTVRLMWQAYQQLPEETKAQMQKTKPAARIAPSRHRPEQDEPNPDQSAPKARD